MLPRIAIFALFVITLQQEFFRDCEGQDAVQAFDLIELKSQLNAQAAEIRALRQRIDREEAVFVPSRDSRPTSDTAELNDSLTRPAGLVVEYADASIGDTGQSPARNFYADYDKGFVIRPFSSDTHPFELKFNGWMQFRHHAFSRNADTWTDNAGVTRPIINRNELDVERARLVFSGYSLDKRLTYFLQLDGDTDGRHSVDFFDYWWSWKFSDSFRMQLGKRKVPASRQWLLGARRTRLIDRPMANDFFRPDRSVGVFGLGTIGNTGHYEVMVGNGYFTTNLPSTLTDSKFTYAITNYFDLLGDFGGQVADYDYTCNPLIRVGHSFVFSPQSARVRGVPLGEADFVRLTDGTRLTQTGALANGVTVSDFDIYFYGVDAALKWQGWSLNAEVFLRWIENLQADGPLPANDLFQTGFYVEGGRFLIPRTLDVNFRFSQVNGEHGHSSEFAAGFNWYPLDTPKLKLSFDVTSLDGSPLQNTSSDILVGDNGTLFRTQFQAEF